MPNGNHPVLSPICPMGVADTLGPWVMCLFLGPEKSVHHEMAFGEVSKIHIKPAWLHKNAYKSM